MWKLWFYCNSAVSNVTFRLMCVDSKHIYQTQTLLLFLIAESAFWHKIHAQLLSQRNLPGFDRTLMLLHTTMLTSTSEDTHKAWTVKIFSDHSSTLKPFPATYPPPPTHTNNDHLWSVCDRNSLSVRSATKYSGSSRLSLGFVFLLSPLFCPQSPPSTTFYLWREACITSHHI